jgi:NADH:ubiquinone oxidoreductase subunit 6 (subunit J)
MGIAVFSALLLILVKNPIYSIFSLILSIISSVIVLLICHVEFLAYVFLIVYVGAISILFLFVVMMLNIKVSQNVLVDFSTWEFYTLVFILPKFIFMSNVVIESCLNSGVHYFR